MNKNFETFCEKYGFINDDTKEILKRIFSYGSFKKMYVQMYIDEPYMLLLRTEEFDVKAYTENERFIIQKNDTVKTIITNFIEKSIDKCIVKEYNKKSYEVLISIHNINYNLKIFI